MVNENNVRHGGSPVSCFAVPPDLSDQHSLCMYRELHTLVTSIINVIDIHVVPPCMQVFAYASLPSLSIPGKENKNGQHCQMFSTWGNDGKAKSLNHVQ